MNKEQGILNKELARRKDENRSLLHPIAIGSIFLAPCSIFNKEQGILNKELARRKDENRSLLHPIAIGSIFLVPCSLFNKTFLNLMTLPLRGVPPKLTSVLLIKTDSILTKHAIGCCVSVRCSTHGDIIATRIQG